MCESSYIQLQDTHLEQIKNGVHSEFLPHICFVCNKACPTGYDLMIHEQKAHASSIKERQFRCNECINTYNTKQDLKRHMETHSGEYNYFCHICNIGYNK